MAGADKIKGSSDNNLNDDAPMIHHLSEGQTSKRIERVSAALIAGLDLDTLLTKIAGEAAVVMGAATSLMLWDESKDHLVIKASQGLSDQYIRQHYIPREEVQAAFERVEQEDLFLWPHTQHDPLGRQDLIEREGIQAILSIPLVAQAQLIGLLTIYAKERARQFSRDEGELARIFANLAVVAIQNAERIDELEKIKDREYASQVVAWLGLFGADWQHTIHQKTFSIGNYVDGLRRWLAGQEVPAAVTAIVDEALDGIESVTESIRNVQFTSPIPFETPGEAIGETNIDPELKTMVYRWAENRNDVKKIFDLNCPSLKVKIQPQWLRVAMEKLVNNALKAMPDGGELTVATEQVADMVHITITDTGKRGIPDFALPHFLKRPVKRPPDNKTPGTGKGVLIARFVALSYGGDLSLVYSRKGEGTRLLMTLPIFINHPDQIIEQNPFQQRKGRD